jgi:hypothetical protein
MGGFSYYQASCSPGIASNYLSGNCARRSISFTYRAADARPENGRLVAILKSQENFSNRRSSCAALLRKSHAQDSIRMKTAVVE